jgi:hypothetical protein
MSLVLFIFQLNLQQKKEKILMKVVISGGGTEDIFTGLGYSQWDKGQASCFTYIICRYQQGLESKIVAQVDWISLRWIFPG